MLEQLKAADVEVGIEAVDWREAIQKAARRLLETEAIEPRYVEGMIRAVEENGPYIVIGRHIALAHTRPDQGVNRMGISFTTIKNGVAFGATDFDPVKLIITLAATDADSHLELLVELTDVLMDEERVARLIAAPTAEVFYAELMRGDPS
ncbi:PTS sugar transporter subunit IIA [Listeria ilorinensis]|uniref:PTS sugar transporter subunit IIA n=1 Tax=Listeria ilorinensis TaxID=2867439 RepID=UPI001EF5018F|nr:PTS sugar transporter subunit IIA [Listeria ilorinensis]